MKFILLFVLLFPFTASAQLVPHPDQNEQSEGRVNLVDTAQQLGHFDTFVSALRETGLDAELNAGGPYTVFAPTDEAFNHLSSETRAALFADKTRLKQILLYHVVPEELYAPDVVHRNLHKTLMGPRIQVRIRGNAPIINQARIVESDIIATNGIIHAIDGILVP